MARRRQSSVVPIENGARIFDPKDPLAIARRFIAELYTRDKHRLIHAWRGDLHVYTGAHFQELEEAAARAEWYGYLEAASRRTATGIRPFQPSATVVNNVMDALRAAAHLRSSVVAPAWLDGRERPSPSEMIACENGLLHYPTRALYPHTPAYFGTYSLPFRYDRDVQRPTAWLDFLRSVWENDEEAISCLQEMFGYILSGDRRQQKMFLLVGPKRAGKDTIARVLQRLMGPANCAGPTLSSLAGPFGLQSLIGKPLAVISDARLSGRADQAVIAERLLSVTGEGFLSVDRKHRETWDGQLPTRFVILTNELPRLEDSSGALASRFIVLTLSRSWYGREDTSLFERLVPELPAILDWALDGLERLWDRNRFTVPRSSADAVRELDELGSPIRAFVRDCCEVKPGVSTETKELYHAWTSWCQAHGRTHPKTEQVFGRDLRAAAPGVVRKQRETMSDTGGRERWAEYEGILITSRLPAHDSDGAF